MVITFFWQEVPSLTSTLETPSTGFEIVGFGVKRLSDLQCCCCVGSG